MPLTRKEQENLLFDKLEAKEVNVKNAARTIFGILIKYTNSEIVHSYCEKR